MARTGPARGQLKEGTALHNKELLLRRLPAWLSLDTVSRVNSARRGSLQHQWAVYGRLCG